MRGSGRWPIRSFRRSRLPLKLQRGPKARSDYGASGYEDDMAIDDFGSKYNVRKESPDIDLGPGALSMRRDDR